MNLPAGVFHESFCAALARYHASIGVRATNPADQDFHVRRADAFIDSVKLPPSQMRLVLALSDRFQDFGLVRSKLVAALLKRPPDSTPAGV
jgi:hypothetical protein